MDAKDPKRGNQLEMNKVEREARADAAIFEGMKQKGPPRYSFLYKLTVKNTGAKTIKTIDWDYVFFDLGTQNEVGRHQFTAEEKISPGKRKEFLVMFNKPPAKTISAYALNKGDKENLGEQVIMIRIEYTDGSVWQRP
jgi:hypothetical protein